MSEPGKKSPGIRRLLEDVFKRTTRMEASVCVRCQQHVTSDEFEDELSKKEFKISGLCQGCQNYVFGN